MAVYSGRLKQFLMIGDNGGKFVVKNPRGDIVDMAHTAEGAEELAKGWNRMYQETAYTWEPWDDAKAAW
jgi:hypothetical protein